MAQGWAKAFYNSSSWIKQREYILKRDNYMCQRPGCHHLATEVHHIIELNERNVNDLNICLNEKNLISLCHGCHTHITHEMKTKTNDILPNVYFDNDGYVHTI